MYHLIFCLTALIWGSSAQGFFAQDGNISMEENAPAKATVGVGVIVSRDGDGLLSIQYVMEGTPASRAGLQAGDKIHQIDSSPVSDMSGLEEALAALGGRPGTIVELGVYRKETGLSESFTLVRVEVPLP